MSPVRRQGVVERLPAWWIVRSEEYMKKCGRAV